VTHSGCPQQSPITYSVAESFRVRVCPEIKLWIRCTEKGFRFVPPADSDVRSVVPNSSPTSGAIVTFFGGSEDLCLLRWQNLKTSCARSFGGSIHYSIIAFSVFAKVPGIFVPNAISHYGRPSQFVLIRFSARRLHYIRLACSFPII